MEGPTTCLNVGHGASVYAEAHNLMSNVHIRSDAQFVDGSLLFS